MNRRGLQWHARRSLLSPFVPQERCYARSCRESLRIFLPPLRSRLGGRDGCATAVLGREASTPLQSPLRQRDLLSPEQRSCQRRLRTEGRYSVPDFRGYARHDGQARPTTPPSENQESWGAPVASMFGLRSTSSGVAGPVQQFHQPASTVLFQPVRARLVIAGLTPYQLRPGLWRPNVRSVQPRDQHRSRAL